MSSSFDAALREAAVEALRETVARHMPVGPMRDYHAWGLAPGHLHHERFVRATGATQIVNLFAAFVGDLVPEADHAAVAHLLGRKIAYLTLEIISDNLAIGLADAPAAGRRRLLRAFNTAMAIRLRGSGRAAADLLRGERAVARTVSALDQSLVPDVHLGLARAFLAGSRHTTADLAGDVWPALVANIEAGADAAATLDGTPLGPEVRDGLLNRYRAVGRTLAGGHLSRLELATVGAHTVLVAPTLTYALGALVGRPGPRLVGTVRDGTLSELFYEAATLVRLLNDIGPLLLNLDADRRWALLEPARRRGRSGAAAATLLVELATGPEFTRLRKDLRFGEFNVCLYNLRRAGAAPEALAALAADLDFFASAYALHRGRLTESAARLTGRTGDPRAAELALRFVDFHERLYANPADAAHGEYAI